MLERKNSQNKLQPQSKRPTEPAQDIKACRALGLALATDLDGQRFSFLNDASRSLFSTMANEIGAVAASEAQQAKGIRIKDGLVSKNLQKNLHLIFKNAPVTTRISQPQQGPKQQVAFKIGSSFDNPLKKSHLLTDESGNRSKSKAGSRDRSKGLPRESSDKKLTIVSNRSKDRKAGDYDKQEIKKKVDRPPIPKASVKMGRKASEGSNVAEAEISSKTIKVNVNVQICTKPAEANCQHMFPPKPPGSKIAVVQEARERPAKDKSSSQGHLHLPPVTNARRNQAREIYAEDLDQAEMSHAAIEAIKLIKEEARQAVGKHHLSQQNDILKKAIEDAISYHNDKKDYNRQNCRRQSSDIVIHNGKHGRCMAESKELIRQGLAGQQLPLASTPSILLDSLASPSPPRRHGSFDSLSSSSKHRVQWLLSDTLTRQLYNMLARNKSKADN